MNVLLMPCDLHEGPAVNEFPLDANPITSIYFINDCMVLLLVPTNFSYSSTTPKYIHSSVLLFATGNLMLALLVHMEWVLLYAKFLDLISPCHLCISMVHCKYSLL